MYLLRHIILSIVWFGYAFQRNVLFIRPQYKGLKDQALKYSPVSCHQHEKLTHCNAARTESNVIDDSQNLLSFAKTVWDFSRPHTVIGSILSIISLFAFASPVNHWFTLKFMKSAMNSILPAVLINIYITGLNQVTDVDIDKVNKPYLPIASGKLSLGSGISIVLGSLLAAVLLSLNSAWPLKSALYGSALLGTVYSLPPFRLKRFPLLAAMCILAVRGSVINLCFFFQAKSILLGIDFPSLAQAVAAYPESIAVTGFFAAFGLVIAFLKDVPDVQGDLRFGVRSFSVRVGAAKMFLVSWRLLQLLLSTASVGVLGSLLVDSLGSFSSLVRGGTLRAIFSGLFSRSWTQIASRAVVGAVLTFFAMDVQTRAQEVNVKLPSKIFDFYMHVWKIFYACYILLPLTSLT